MTFTFDEERNKVRDCLAAINVTIKADTAIQRTSFAKDAEGFYKNVLNCVYGYALQKTDKYSFSYPAIDLIDLQKRVGVQVTAQSDKGKIKKTVKQFIDRKIYNECDELYIFFIGNKPEYSPNSTSDSLTFTKKNLLDNSDILKKIDANHDYSILNCIKSLISREKPQIYKIIMLPAAENEISEGKKQHDLKYLKYVSRYLHLRTLKQWSANERATIQSKTLHLIDRFNEVVFDEIHENNYFFYDNKLGEILYSVCLLCYESISSEYYESAGYFYSESRLNFDHLRISESDKHSMRLKEERRLRKIKNKLNLAIRALENHLHENYEEIIPRDLGVVGYDDILKDIEELQKK